MLEVVRPAADMPIGEFNPQGLARTTWAMATLAVEETELVQAVRPAADTPIGESNPQNLANTTRAKATLAVEDPELVVAERPAAPQAKKRQSEEAKRGDTKL